MFSTTRKNILLNFFLQDKLEKTNFMKEIVAGAILAGAEGQILAGAIFIAGLSTHFIVTGA